MEDILKEILRAVEPSPADREVRRRILLELQAAVESVERLRGATVEPFGSFVSELFTRWGDMDVSIEFSKGSYVSSFGKKQTKDVLRDIMKALRTRGGWNFFQFIPHARIPILMVKSKLNNISCDISVNNLRAQMKSKLLLWISDIDPRFHDMILLVKEWAKAHNINNSKSGTFNSYSLSMLVVFHFQTCVPAILPPLREIYQGTLTDDLQGLRDDTESRIESSCVENIRRFKTSRLRNQNKSSLSELFISFLGKFADLGSKAMELGISTYSGQWEALESNIEWLPKTYTILVEDPFDRPENTARAVGAKALLRISEAFALTRGRLIAASYSSSLANQSSLLTNLVRPQTLNHIIRNPGYNIEHQQTTHPQDIMAESSHSRTRHLNGAPKSNGPYCPHVPNGPFVPQMVPSRGYHNRPQVPNGASVPQLVPSRGYHNRPQVPNGPSVPQLVPHNNLPPKPYDRSVSRQQKPTGPYVGEHVGSSPQVHQQPPRPAQSSSQRFPQLQKLPQYSDAEELDLSNPHVGNQSQGSLTLHTNASVTNGAVGLAALFRDHNGELKAALGEGCSDFMSPRASELKALIMGLDWAACRNWRVGKVFSDCLQAVQIINGMEECFAEDGELVDHVRCLLQRLGGINITYTPRASNGAAGVIARTVRSLRGKRLWLGSGPSWLMNVIDSDRILEPANNLSN